MSSESPNIMADKLAEICSTKYAHVAMRKNEIPFREIENKIAQNPPPRGFMAALAKASKTGFGLIAEIKRASPSKGLIRADFNPAEHAKAYQAGGASCLSVLTDTPYFQGANTHLIEAREACTLPVLRKDFMVDPWQIAESRALGADAILLIVAALEQSQMQEMEIAAMEYGMDVLVEVHNVAELDRARQLKTKLLGINNRDLKSFKTSLSVSESLARLVGRNYCCVSESGISKYENCDRLSKHGVRCFLVGESLMRQADLSKAVQKLINPKII